MPGRVCRCPIKCRSFKGFALPRFRLIAVTENSGSYPYVASALRFIPAQADGCLFVPLAHSMTTPRDVRGFPSSVLSAMRTSPRPCHEARSHELRMVDLDAGSPGPLAPKQIWRPRSIEFATRGKAASQQRRNGCIRGAWLSPHAVFETGEEAPGSAMEGPTWCLWNQAHRHCCRHGEHFALLQFIEICMVFIRGRSSDGRALA